MSYTITLQVAQIDGSDFVKTDETADVELRSDPYAAAYRVGSHIGNGVYQFTTVASGMYRLYDTSAGTQLTSFGDIVVGEGGAVHTTGNETIGGAKTFSAVATFSSGLNTNTISERTSGSGVTVDGLLIKDTGISGACTFDTLPTCSATVSSSSQLANKTYVDTAIAQAGLNGYVQGSLFIRILNGVTEIAGKNYSDIGNAIAYVGATSATSRYIFQLEQGQSDSNYANIFPVTHTELAALTNGYCTIKGLSRNGSIVLLGGTGDTAALALANLCFEDCTIFMSNNYLTSARTYTSIKFINCSIFHYANITFSGCELIGCMVYSASTQTLTGAGKCLGTYFNQSVTESAYTGDKAYVDSVNTGASMPTEPDLGS